MDQKIEPRILKGFRDFLPERELQRRAIQRTLEETFRSFGFVPIDTPVLEYADVLLGKGGGETDKQVYQFNDRGKRDVAMRFDLTVPFARFMAMHQNELPLPFKRYHIAKVWRGENTQRGRYREFIQCDFDIVGTESVYADLEVMLLIASVFEAMETGGITIRFSDRGVFNGFLDREGLASRSVDILRAVDKLGKIGKGAVREILTGFTSQDQADRILEFIEPDGDFTEVIARMEELSGGASPGTVRLRTIYGALSEIESPCSFVLDPSITRGLDYYTGTVYETFLDALPDIGSVCSGGRYDDLASLYTSTHIPGVGASVGLDRLMAAMEELGLLGLSTAPAQVIILSIDDSAIPRCHRLAAGLRSSGISAEVSFEKRKPVQLFTAAEKRGIPFALICDGAAATEETVTIRELSTRESRSGLSLDDCIRYIRSRQS